MQSFLNVIADSGVVETFILTKLEMQYLHDIYLKFIYERLIGAKEPDRPCTEEQVIEQFIQYHDWEKWKVKKVEQIHKL